MVHNKMKQILSLTITVILTTLVGCSRPETVVLAPVPLPIENIDSMDAYQMSETAVSETVVLAPVPLPLENIGSMDVYQCLEALDNISKISFRGSKSGYSQEVVDRLKFEQCSVFNRYKIVTGSPWDNKENYDDAGNYIGPVWEHNGKKYPNFPDV
jgi:hypothetical protein